MPEYVFNQSTLTLDSFLGYRNRQRALKYKKKLRDKLGLSNIWLTGVLGKSQRNLGQDVVKRNKEPQSSKLKEQAGVFSWNFEEISHCHRASSVTDEKSEDIQVFISLQFLLLPGRF